MRSFESVIGPRGFAVTRAYTARQGLALVPVLRPDAVLLSTHLTDMDVVEVLQALASGPHAGPTLPVIVTSSGMDGNGHKADYLRAGAWAVVQPPIDAESLLAQLQVFVRARVESERLRQAALVDEETGFYSLRGLARRGRELAADAYRRSAPLACIVVGLDPESGSDAIASLADALRRVSRSSDLVGRVGANEFALLAEVEATAGADAFADRLRDAFADGDAAARALRLGVAHVSNYREAALPIDDLLKRAAGSAARLGTTLPS